MKRTLLIVLLALIATLCLTFGIVGCSDETEESENISQSNHVTSGLSYQTTSDLQSYSVTGIGEATDNDIVIPDSYNGLPVTGIAEGAFSSITGITSITIPSTITSIGDSAFSGCTKLTTIYWNAAECTTVGDNLYEGCKALKTFVIGSTVKSLPAYCFTGGTFTIEWTDGNGITEIGAYVFYNYVGYSVTIPSYIVSIGDYAFYGCTKLATINLPDSITTIGDSAFYGCSALTSITIPDSVTTIGEKAFYNCKSLTNVSIGNGMTTINNDVFHGCYSLKTISIPNNISSIGDYAFCGCYKLTRINITDNITTIGNYAFYDCYSLEGVYITNLNTWFNINFDNNYANPLYYAGSLYENEELVTKLVIPEGVTTVNDYTFYGCTSLTSITIGNSVTSIASTAFQYCYKLVEVYNLSELEINVGSTSNGYIGYYAKNIYTSTDINSKVYIDDNGFIIYADDESNGYYLVGYIGNSSDIILPESINGNKYSINQYAFYNCTSLTSVTIPDSVTSIGNYAFYNCTSLIKIYYNATSCEDFTITSHIFNNAGKNSKGITVFIGANVIKIPNYLFYSANIVSIVFEEDSVCEIIGYCAFNSCTNLISVTIPYNVTEILDYAFGGCTLIERIYYVGMEADWKEITIGLYNTYLTKATIYYYSEEEPTKEGNYWHYVDGVATAW